MMTGTQIRSYTRYVVTGICEPRPTGVYWHPICRILCQDIFINWWVWVCKVWLVGRCTKLT
jgi:hypothetical protein